MSTRRPPFEYPTFSSSSYSDYTTPTQHMSWPSLCWLTGLIPSFPLVKECDVEGGIGNGQRTITLFADREGESPLFQQMVKGKRVGSQGMGCPINLPSVHSAYWFNTRWLCNRFAPLVSRSIQAGKCFFTVVHYIISWMLSIFLFNSCFIFLSPPLSRPCMKLARHSP